MASNDDPWATISGEVQRARLCPTRSDALRREREHDATGAAGGKRSDRPKGVSGP